MSFQNYLKTPRKKTPNPVLPWLRETLGLTQSQLANLIGAAQSTIQAVELGRLPLSERFAWAISQNIGVDAHWLLAGKLLDPCPIRSLSGNATRKHRKATCPEDFIF